MNFSSGTCYLPPGAIVGTFCNDEIQGLFAQKRKVCMDCVFFKKVKKEEGKNFQLLLTGQNNIIIDENDEDEEYLLQNYIVYDIILLENMKRGWKEWKEWRNSLIVLIRIIGHLRYLLLLFLLSQLLLYGLFLGL